MVLEIKPIELFGKWRRGWALHVHTISSTPRGYNEYGHMQFDTLRPEIAEHLHRLKYRADSSAASPIAQAAVQYLKPAKRKFSLIVPAPPSRQRAVQPVLILAEAISHELQIPYANCITVNATGPELKNLKDQAQRDEALKGRYAVNPKDTAGKNILVVDDLYNSGGTLNAITEALLVQGKAADVCVLAITKTKAGQ